MLYLTVVEDQMLSGTNSCWDYRIAGSNALLGSLPSSLGAIKELKDLDIGVY